VLHGSHITAGLGDPESHIAALHAVMSDSGAFVDVELTPATGYGGLYGIYWDTRLAATVQASAGVATSARVSVPTAGTGVSSLVVLRHGTAGPADGDYGIAAGLIDSDIRQRARLLIDMTPTVTDSPAGLSGWSPAPWAYSRTDTTPGGYYRRALTVTATLASPIITINLTYGDDARPVATGTVADTGGVCRLSDGTEVTVAASHAGTGTINIAYPAYVEVARGGTTQQRIPFAGRVRELYVDRTQQTGTQTYTITPYSDRHVAGDVATVDVTYPALPGGIDPAAELNDWTATATQIIMDVVTAQNDGLLSVYHRGPADSRYNLITPDAITVGASSTTVAVPLPAAGVSYYIIRARSAIGVESAVASTRTVTLDGSGRPVYEALPADVTDMGVDGLTWSFSARLRSGIAPGGPNAVSSGVNIYYAADGLPFDFDSAPLSTISWDMGTTAIASGAVTLPEGAGRVAVVPVVQQAGYSTLASRYAPIDVYASSDTLDAPDIVRT